MDPLFFAVFSVMSSRPVMYLDGDTEEGELDDGWTGSFWGGTEAVYDVPVGYGEVL